MRCLSCEYPLKGLVEHRCPECGREFDPNDPKTFDDGQRARLYGRWRRAEVAAIAAVFVFSALIVFSSSDHRMTSLPFVALLALMVTVGSLPVILTVSFLARWARNGLRSDRVQQLARHRLTRMLLLGAIYLASFCWLFVSAGMHLGWRMWWIKVPITAIMALVPTSMVYVFGSFAWDLVRRER